MKNIIKVLLVVMALVLVITAFTACEPEQPEVPEVPENPTPEVCKHENVEFVLGTEPTCTEDGLTSGFKCKDCGEWTVAQEVDPAGHDYTVDVEVDATCTDPGYTEKKCARCDATTDHEVIEPYGHELVDAEGKDATCTEDGYSDYKACKYCDHVEGVTVIPAGHKYVDGVCQACKGVVTYFVNVNKWANVYAHMWNASGDITSWPGVAMTKTGETVNGCDVYMVESAKVPANIIFNNNAGAQTADLAFVGGKYFSMLNATWYDSYEDVPQFTTTTYYLPGSFNSWNQTGNQFVKEGTSTVIRSYIALEANKTYTFKIKNGSAWYGSSTKLTATTTVATLSTSGGDISITTKCAGVYVFEVDTAASTKKVTVIYPHTEVAVEGKAPTCTETGLTEGKKCSVCGTVTVKQETIPTVEHAWLDAEAVIKECGDCGLVWNSHFAGGKGTAEEPYLIENAEQLMNITLYYDTYQYYKVADGVKTIDMTGYGKGSLHGSLDGNGVKLVNLTTALFQYVGYNNQVEEIKISNIDATMNAVDGCAFVRNIFNGGKTTFENVALHGYVEGLYNMGSFYNYGTANCDGTGADYTVEFINSTSDMTLVCTSGNIAGGFLGHSFEGKDNAFTMIIDEKSAFTGKILTTNGKGNLYFAMTSDYNNALNKFIIAGEEVHFNNGNIPAAANLGKIAVVAPTVGENGYVVAPVDGVASTVVYLNAQVTAHNEDGTKVPNKAGMTWPLGHFDLEELNAMGLITSAVIVNGTDHDYGYEVVDGVLTIYSGRSANYCSGTVRLQVNQYDAEGNLLATGTINVYTIEHPHTFVGGDCTTDAVCGCGAKQAAPGHAWVDVEAQAPTCAVAGYTAHKACDECGATEGKEALDKIAHADEDANYRCDACECYLLPDVGTSFKLQLVQATLGKTLYFTGNMSGYYYETSEAISAAKDLYLEEVDGGYHMYFLNGEAKNYLYVVASGTYINVKIGTTPSGVWTWNENFGMFVTKINGTDYYIGTYNSYNTISASKTSFVNSSNVNVSQFIARPYVVPAHECDYTEATCTALSTCKICGVATGELLPHDYTVEATCTANAKCACGAEKEDSALGHTTDNGTCERCGKELGEGVAPVEVTISKSAADLMGLAGLATTNGTSVNNIEINLDDNISIICSQGKAGTAPSYYSPAIRLYQNGATLTVKGTGMKTIIITCNSTSGDGPISVVGGTASALTSMKYTITVDADVDEVVITTTGTDKNSRVYVSNIEVVYEN